MKRWANFVGDSVLQIVDDESKCAEGVQWIEVGEDVQSGDRLVDGVFYRPGLAPADVRARCVADLSISDIRVTRALEAGEGVPEELRAYRAALRAIHRSGIAPEPWPEIPAYDANNSTAKV